MVIHGVQTTEKKLRVHLGRNEVATLLSEKQESEFTGKWLL